KSALRVDREAAVDPRRAQRSRAARRRSFGCCAGTVGRARCAGSSRRGGERRARVPPFGHRLPPPALAGEPPRRRRERQRDRECGARPHSPAFFKRLAWARKMDGGLDSKIETRPTTWFTSSKWLWK